MAGETELLRVDLSEVAEALLPWEFEREPANRRFLDFWENVQIMI